MKFKFKLKQSIYVMVFLCSFVPVFIWIIFSIYDSEQRIENVITNNIEAIGGSQVMSIENFCEGRKESMETIARMDLVKNAIINYDSDGNSQELDIFLTNNENQKSYIASISVIDTDFNIVGSSEKYDKNSTSNLKYSGEKYHSGAFVVGNVHERQTDNGMKSMIPACIGIYNEGELIGYLISEIECEYFDRMRLQTDFLEDGTLYLMDGKKNIITAGTASEVSSREELVSTEVQLHGYYDAWEEFKNENKTDGVIYYEYNNQKYMTYVSDIEYTDWNIRITENMSAQWKSNQSVYIFIMIEGIAVAAILVYVQIMITGKLVAPFNKIVATLKEIQDRHDYSLRTKVLRNDEVGVVAKGIDELLDYIEKEELAEKRKHREFEKKANAEAEKLHHKEFLSESVITNMPSGYHRCLPDSEKGFPFIQLGSHFEEILGWTADEIKNELGNCYRNLIWPEDLDVVTKYNDMVSRVGLGNAYDTSVYRMKHKDGNYRWITDATMFVDLGEESFFQGVIADITPYVEGMEEAKKLAEANSHAKTDFLSQMSHDIRTPMNAIIGFTKLAKESESVEIIQNEYIPKIDIASKQLLMIINDVLEMSSIEKGKMVFNESANNIDLMINDIITVMDIQAKEKGLCLISDVHIKDKYIYCDESYVNRVFMNLMSNAIKFTPAGGSITMSVVQQDKQEEGYALYQFKVSDTGIGMASEFAPLVFEPFERERTSTISRVDGTGLGMAIVKRIVDAAGGTISVDSVPGEGTTFIINIKFALAESEEVSEKNSSYDEKTGQNMSHEKLSEYFEGKRILLAEDNEFNRIIAETILEKAGFIVEQAEDGSIAVEMVKNASSYDYYDVILMDIQMPIMNGYEATRAIRAMSDERSKVKIIAVTANAFESDKKNAKDAGMDGHIAKPIDVNILYDTLLEITGKIMT